MKLNKIARRLASALMVGAMTVSMMGMTVSAAPVSDGGTKTATITKKINKDEKVFAPVAEFMFTIAPGSERSGVKNESGNILESPNGGIYFRTDKGNAAKASITSAPKVEDLNLTEIVCGSLDLMIDETKFSVPGIYQYTISEEAGNIEGVEYDTKVRYVDVYIYGDDTTPATLCFVTQDADGNWVKDDGIFINNYGIRENEVNDLTVKKVVTGNQGDRNRLFTFKIQMDGADDEWFNLEYGDEDGEKKNEIVIAKKNSISISLKDGQIATIYGLSETDRYTVEEENYSGEGYVTKVDDVVGRDASGTITADTTITFTNEKNADVATGIIMNIAPYVLMVAVAGVLAFLFLRKKKSDF